MAKNCKRAFTLIELLVVIAIIALLMAVLLPAMTKAKDQGRRLLCKSNMRQCGIGVMMYSQENNLYIPPLNNSDSTKEGGSGTQRTNHWARWFRRTDIGSGGTNPWAPWWNLGFIFRDGYIDDGKVFYCPTPRSVYKYEQYSNPVFPTDNTSGGVSGTRVSYFYNPVCKGPIGNSYRLRRYKKVTDLSSNRLLATDLLLPGEVIHYGPGWNMLYGDGSVGFIKSREIFDLMLEDREGVGFSTDNYLLFDKVMDEIMPGSFGH